MTSQGVLVVGGVGIDHIVRVPELPLPFIDALPVAPIQTCVAHTGNGVALGCQALGLRTVIVDVVGDDPEAGLIRSAYGRAGLEHEFVTHPSGTRRSVNLVAPDGRRMSFYDGRHPSTLVPDAALWRQRIPTSRLVHVTIMNWARHALADAVAAGRLTSTDLHDWDGHSDHHHDFAYGADLVFVSATALGGRHREVVDDIFSHGRARLVVVMDGARGSTLVERGRKPVPIAAVTLPDLPVVDSNGAGDSYVAAFLATLLGGADPLRAAHAGSIGGAFACGTPGTHTRFIDSARLARELSLVA